MLKKTLLASSLAFWCALHSNAQSSSVSFNQFRQNIFQNYNNFKSRILEHYDDFLNGQWHEFEPIFEPESPYSESKPREIPEFVEEGESLTNAAADYNLTPIANNVTLPASTSDTKPYPSQTSDSKSIPTTSMSAVPNLLLHSRHKKMSNYEYAASGIADPEFIFGPLPEQQSLPLPGECGAVNSCDTIENYQSKFIFDFYGMKAFVTYYPFDILPEFEGINDTGTHWIMMSAQKGGVETARQLFGLASKLGLNGYLTFRLTEAYVRQSFPDATINAQMSAVHFLLSQMGYDVRLVMTNDLLTIMMPFDQKIVYSSIYVTGENGRKYTILYPEGHEYKRGESLRLRTCAMPAEATGKTSDLRLTGLNLPMKSKNFSISNSYLNLRGKVNENLKKMLHRYPQMPNGDFASSWLDPELRDSLVAQVKEQLSGFDRKQAVNALLNLCHYSFAYKSDQEWHIFEKPYFVEENFLYEFNDCEDRAIFMSYLIWHAFGMPCQLIQYPGHESVAVAVDEDVRGHYYNTEGMKFYSSDPTYKGSRIGYVMPPYESTAPSIDKLYK